MTRSRVFWLSLVLCGAFGAGRLHAQQITADLRAEARQALKKAATHYHAKLASHGGYVYYYSVDLQERWGEGKAAPDTIFVQPPGTPTVGAAYLKAYAATRDRFYLDAAREAAEALVFGQLQSGGWTQVIQFAEAKQLGKYRNRRGGNRNSSLDDGQTQAALLLLIRVDQALDFKHAEIHEAANYGLQALLQAQFPNGAFPQVWTGPVESKPVSKARFPDYDWKTEGRVKKKSLLADGTVARYYEFKTNRPLYMDSKYQLTYDESTAPSHYGWKQPARFAEIERAYQNAKSGTGPAGPRSAAELEKAVRGIIRELDEEGLWITTYAGERLVGQPKFSPSFRFISSAVFSRNVAILSGFVASPAAVDGGGF